MPKVQPFTVTAHLPAELQPLRDMAHNLWWTWNHAARNLFVRISKERSLKARVNPIELINSLSSQEIATLVKDKGFLAQLDAISRSYQMYKESRTWWTSEIDGDADLMIAYFSLEYGLHESLLIYSGGLGVLAGDHLKAASDLGVPLVAVGLLYYEGYFSQYLNADGWQQESYPRISMDRQPVQPVLGPDGKPVSTTISINGVPVVVKAWRVDVGQVPLFLLDTNVEENPLTMRAITSRLYGGDTHSRIQQEIVLGMAGYKLLKALGYSPSAYHMNEGHSAFLAIAQIKDLVANHGLSFEEALTGVQHSNLFTTHTPVPAGNDVFPREMIDQYFAQDARDIGIRMETLLNLGRVQENDPHEPFSMTVLALKCSKTANGVSKLHGHVSRKLWHRLWPGLPLDESPIKSITNGIHTATFTARDMADLYDRYLGPAWRNQTAAPETWDGVDMIPDEELWRIRCRNRSLLVTYCRDRLRDQLLRRGAGRMELEDAANELSPDALTIGFARRFATYKRATLLLHDIDRLAKILSNPERPVQFLFSGKAHPADNLGKELILRLVHARRRPELRGKIVFIEDYDMNVARRLVQGVDVWLNNPRRPLEACGTSGMKAAVNGALNMSVLDGWWYEAFDGSNGWSIGQGEEYDDSGYQDEVESRSIYDLLEREIIPTFYDRTPRGVPVDWVKLMKQSIRSIAPHFSAARMVGDYCRECYGPIAKDYRAVVAAQFRPVREARAKTEQFRKHWGELRILSVETQKAEQIPIGKSLPLKVVVHLGPFTPEEVAVQVRYGTLDVTNQIHGAHLYRMLRGQPGAEPGVYVFEGELASERAGTFGFSVRLIPVLHSAPHPAIPGLITWWE